jgi:hypothetical protein
MTYVLYGYAAFLMLACAFFALRYFLRDRAERRNNITQNTWRNT